MDVLMDIAEPGAAPKPHDARPIEPRRVVGIDLGTTFSLVAAMNLQGAPACIPDGAGHLSLPSIVHLGADGNVLVGREAHPLAITHPEETIVSVKRFMGRGLADVPAGGYRLEAGAGGMVRFHAGGRGWSPVEISAKILENLKKRAEATLGGPLYGAVVTVPAYFDDAQRQATKDACRLAGLEVLRLVNEPTAAALAYGLDQNREGVYAIYDLGGGTFDISILKLTQGVFQVMATGGNSALGGDDFDRRLGMLFLQEMELTSPTPGQLHGAFQEARRVKEALTTAAMVEANLAFPDGRSYRREVGRAEFAALTQEYVRATGVPCRRALKDAGVTPEDLQGVVLVGGSTRMPTIRDFVADLFKQEPLVDLDPDQIVALGAAIQADLLAGRQRSDVLLLDVTPLSLGLETMGGLVEKVVPRNSPIPTARAQEFTTFKDGQGAMAIHVVQGERETVEQCRSLARFELRGIPPMVAGAARIRVTFQVDADGLLTVSAREQTTGVEQSVAVKPSYGLGDGEIERMLREALEHGEEDLQRRHLQEARVDAERVLVALQAALATDRHLLTDAEWQPIEASMLALRAAIGQENHHAILDRIQDLDRATTFFAQRRMDHNIKAVMTGRQLTDFE
ncbi:MAG: Fe-S protein assembly chaperone HscA [Magnetococcales bacterium]|nr:Fe-S protein assembly chaperone HscA [Magnetococcales bacterium]